MKASISIEPTEQAGPSTYSIYKRLANLGLAIAALIIALNIWFFSAGGDTDDLQGQADQLGRSLIAQAAGLAAVSMTAQEPGPVSAQQILNQLAADPHVRAASLHDAKGRQLNQGGERITITGLVGDKKEPGNLVYVQQIMHQDRLQGYLRLILNRTRVLQYQNGLAEHHKQQTRVLMLLAFAIGVLLTRGFYKLRYAQLRQPK